MKLPRIFHADLKNIHHAAFWLAVFSAVSAVLGLFRDRMLAGHFGASRPLDIYYAAFRVPDFIYTLMLFFTAATAIIPIFLERYNSEKKDAENLFGSLLLFFLMAVAILSLVAFILMPYLIKIFLPGFSSVDQKSAVTISRILLFSPIFLGVSNIFSSVTESLRRFIASALSPVFYNLGIIFGILFFLPVFGPVVGLAMGVILGAIMHMSIQIPAILKIGVWPRFDKFWSSDLKKVLKFSFPRTLGLQISQLASIFFTGVASTLATGSIAVFTFASNLQSLPVTIVGLSYSMAAFPNLAAHSISKERDSFREQFSAAFRHILFWTLPAAALLLVLRAQIVRVILGSGAFSWADTRLTAAALFILSLAVIFQSLFILLVWAFYAEGESWRPLFINILSSALGVITVFWFSGSLADGWLRPFVAVALRLSDIPDIRVLALPLGILVGNIVNLILLSFSCKIVFGWFPTVGAVRDILEIILGSSIAGFSAYFGLNIFSYVFDLHTFLGILAQGFFAGILGIIAWILTLLILKNREIHEILSSARSAFLERRLPGSEPAIVPIPEPEKLP